MTSKKDIDQLIERINATPGFVVPDDRTSTCHRRAYRADRDGNPVGRGVTLPGTPGDFNQLHTTRRKLRRNIGWHDPLAKTNQMRKKPKKQRGRETEAMPQISDVARVVRFEDGATTGTPAASTPAPSTAAASTSSRPPAAGDAPPRPPISTSTVRQAARYVWWHIATKAASNPGSATTHDGDSGYTWVGRIPDELREAYPELKGLEKKQFDYLVNRVRAILNEGNRLVSIKPGNPVVASTYFVKKYPPSQDQGAPHVAAPAITPAPAVAPTAPPTDSAPVGITTPQNDESTRGQREVTQTARDLTPAVREPHAGTQDNTRRVSIEDVLVFLGEYDVMLRERDDVIAFVSEVADNSDRMSRAAHALLDRLRGRNDHGSP